MKTAMECATAYLANRMHTIAEVRKHLAEKEYRQEEIDEAIGDLIGLRYLDDYQYALRYYELNNEKRRGVRRAQRELEERGVDRETIKNSCEDFLYENRIDEYALALKIAEGEVYVEDELIGEFTGNRRMKEIDDRLIAKIGRKLETRGFRNEDIFKVIAEVRRWKEETTEQFN